MFWSREEDRRLWRERWAGMSEAEKKRQTRIAVLLTLTCLASAVVGGWAALYGMSQLP